MLCMGINEYKDVRPLETCVRDAESVRDTFRKYDFAGVVLVDDKATTSNALAALATLVGHLRTKDRLLVYFAGHGSKHGDGCISPSTA